MAEAVEADPDPAPEETLEARFARAERLQRQGLLLDAGALYDAILAADPTHFGALRNLGVLRLQQGKALESATLLRRAIAQNPRSAEAHANLAAALQTLGREEAVTLYEEALTLDPSLADASCALGTALQALGRNEEAILRYRAALAQRPDFAEASYGLASAQHALKRYAEAIAAYCAALSADPDYAEASLGLAAVLHMLGRHEEAVARYEAALAVDPDYREANTGLAAALNALKRHQEAIDRCDRALAAEPSHAETHEVRGDALMALGRSQEAADWYAEAIALKPGLLSAHRGYAASLRALNRHQEAIVLSERALGLDPASVATHTRLGELLLETGRFDEAYRAFEKAIEIAPRLPGLYLDLFRCRKVAAADPHLARLEELVRDRDGLPEDERVHLDFALAKAYADLGQNQRSFCHLLSGNAVRRRPISYDEAALMRWFDATPKILSATAMRRCEGCGDPDPAPVFIVGMIRSGTTLVEQILASHPKVHAAGERNDFQAAMQRLLAQAAAGGGGAGAMLGPDDLSRLGAAYVASLRAEAPAAEKITDKMPGNFAHVGLIHLALPNARIIHTRRDPVDTCLSCFSILFGDEQPFAYDLGELGRYYRAYEGLMEHWRRALPAGVMLEVQYEELVRNFETEVPRILAHCGLAWDDACRYFFKTDRPVKTASLAQVRRPLYESSIGRWRPEPALLRPLLEGLGIPE